MESRERIREKEMRKGKRQKVCDKRSGKIEKGRGRQMKRKEGSIE